jgi:ATP-binding protein involved in chromosome partitioning
MFRRLFEFFFQRLLKKRYANIVKRIITDEKFAGYDLSIVQINIKKRLLTLILNGFFELSQKEHVKLIEKEIERYIRQHDRYLVNAKIMISCSLRKSADIKTKVNIVSHKKTNQDTKSSKSKAKLPHFKKIVAVSACKGGVGKSTVAFSLVNSLSKQGLRVGLLDLDIYGPSIPTLIGETNNKFEVNDDGMLIPFVKDNVLYASVGFVVEPEKALIWRGPMISKVINSLVFKCNWGDLDCLVLDLPPGTGDAYLSFFQNFLVNGVILVSTDNVLACADLEKSIDAFHSMDVNILGIVENMSGIYEDKTLVNVSEKFEIDILDRIPFVSFSNSSYGIGESIKSKVNLINTINTIMSLSDIA